MHRVRRGPPGRWCGVSGGDIACGRTRSRPWHSGASRAACRTVPSLGHDMITAVTVGTAVGMIVATRPRNGLASRRMHRACTARRTRRRRSVWSRRCRSSSLPSTCRPCRCSRTPRAATLSHRLVTPATRTRTQTHTQTHIRTRTHTDTQRTRRCGRGFAMAGAVVHGAGEVWRGAADRFRAAEAALLLSAHAVAALPHPCAQRASMPSPPRRPLVVADRRCLPLPPARSAAGPPLPRRSHRIAAHRIVS